MNAVAARPFRFLLMVLALWIGGRGTWLWFAQPGLPFTLTQAPALTAALPEPLLVPPAPAASSPPAIWPAFTQAATPLTITRTTNWVALDFESLMASSPQFAMTMAGMTLAGRHYADHDPPIISAASVGNGFATGPVTPFFVDWTPGFGVTRSTARFSIDSWMLLRGDGRSNPLSPTGQLGGSQAGARLAYALTTSLSTYGRLSVALGTPHVPEAAIGMSFRPDATLPLSINIERRAALNHSGGRNAFAAFAVTGIGPQEIAPGIRVEGYAQGGMVGARRQDAFVDGRLTASRDIVSTRLSLGLTVASAAQPHVARLDIGPRIEGRVGGPLRAALEWRERIAGNARPGSGPALTLAAHF